MPSILRLRLICRRTLFTVCKSCSRPFAERNCGWAGTRTLSAAAVDASAELKDFAQAGYKSLLAGWEEAKKTFGENRK